MVKCIGMWRRLTGLLLALALSAALLSACRQQPATPPPPTPSTEDGDQNEAPTGKEPTPEEQLQARLDGWLGYLTLEEKVGQLLWMGLPGSALTDEARQALANGQIGGFIFFGRQGSDPTVLSALTAEIQSVAAGRERATPGVLVSIDQEGGLVQRLGLPFTQWPGAMALGATGSEELAEAVAAAMARELRAVGINLNLAPVADVNNNPANPVIGVRSFGEDPALVSRLVAAQVRGFQAERVGSVAKHFPGHGDTDTDSHLDLPTVSHDRARLDQVELVPFSSAIATGVSGIMGAHIYFPAVATDGLPATLSAPVLTELLRKELGFQGVALTDSIDGMRAITDRWGLEEAMVMALQAGADMLLVTESFGREQALHAAMVQAVRDGRVSEARVADAARRVLRMKADLGLLPAGDPDGDTDVDSAAARAASVGASAFESTGPSADAASLIGAPEHKALAERGGREALTLVRSAHLPLRLGSEEQILIVGPAYGPRVDGAEEGLTPLGAGIKAVHGHVREILLDRQPTADGIAAVRQAATQAAVIVYGVEEGHVYPEHQALIRALIGSGKPVVVVGLGMPYELTAVPEIETYVAAYGYREPNLIGVGDLLFGRLKAKGRLPVSIPGLYPVGHGL